MIDQAIFSAIGFEDSLGATLHRILSFIEAKEGCNGKVYKPANMRQIRGAHVLPGEDGRKIAKQVFVMIEPRRHSILILRRGKFRKGKPKSQWYVQIDSRFSDWIKLESMLREWSFDPKLPSRPKIEYDFGDGVALSGGLPETNHSKF